MAENVTPVVLKVKDFAEREVMLVDYKFNQATDTEGQVAGIVRGGQITITWRTDHHPREGPQRRQPRVT